MTWTIQIRKGSERYGHVTEELYAALAVAARLLRDGIEVERIDGPQDAQLSIGVIRELTGMVEARSQQLVRKRLRMRVAIGGAGDLWKRVQAMLGDATTSHSG